MLPEIIADVTVDGHIYSMPVNIHRENTLFYNKQIFAAHSLQPPTTIDELLQVCATLKAAGVTPIATAHQGWILRIMFNTLAMGAMGADAFHDYMTGGQRDDDLLAGAIDLFADVLANDVNASASNADFGWTDAADEVAAGRAAMFLHGDWAKGYYVQLGWTPASTSASSARPAPPTCSGTASTFSRCRRPRRTRRRPRTSSPRWARRRARWRSTTSRVRRQSAPTCRSTSSTPWDARRSPTS